MKTRNYYQHIRREAEKDSDMVLNPHWKQALQNLAFAADIMDAVTARSTMYQSSPPDEGDEWKGDRPEPAGEPT